MELLRYLWVVEEGEGRVQRPAVHVVSADIATTGAKAGVHERTIVLTDFARKSRPALLGRDQQRRADQGCRTLLSALLNPARSDARSRVRTAVVPDNGEPKSQRELLHIIVRRVGLGRVGENARGAKQSLFVYDKLDRPAPCSERRDSGLMRTSRVSHGIGCTVEGWRGRSGRETISNLCFLRLLFLAQD